MTELIQTPVALITGAGRRIGACIAAALHQAGYNVVLHYYHSENAAQQLAQSLNHNRSQSAVALKCDLRCPSSLTQLATQATRVFERLDVLVNNAAVFIKTPFTHAQMDEWDNQFSVNLKAPFFLAQACQPALHASQGSIINIAAIHAMRPLKHYSIYNITKAGMVMLTQSLARDLAPDIRVNAIAPGMMLWPEGDNALTSAEQQMICDKIALKRCGHPMDIAKAVCYLAMDAPYTTGQVLTIDGGRSIMG